MSGPPASRVRSTRSSTAETLPAIVCRYAFASNALARSEPRGFGPSTLMASFGECLSLLSLAGELVIERSLGERAGLAAVIADRAIVGREPTH